MKRFLKSIPDIIIFAILVFAIAYVKKPFTCSSNINKVEDIIQQNLPFSVGTLKFSKPKRIKSESGILYCMTSITRKSGNTIQIPYRVKKSGRQISVYVDYVDINYL